jgi:hypothetical protein
MRQREARTKKSQPSFPTSFHIFNAGRERCTWSVCSFGYSLTPRDEAELGMCCAVLCVPTTTTREIETILNVGKGTA